MEDKTARSRRSGLDRCNDTSVSIKRHSSEVCYEDGFGLSRSESSPGHKKISHLGHSVDRDFKRDEQYSNAGHDRCKEQKHKDHKAEVHRLAEYVCGDWSEHVSSSGKRYYYNCRTEVSQWEKPKEWNEVCVVRSSGSSDVSQQVSQLESAVDQSVDADGILLNSCVDAENMTANLQLAVTQKSRPSDHSALQPVLIPCGTSATTNSTKLTINHPLLENSISETENRYLTNSVLPPVVDSYNSMKCQLKESEMSQSVNVSGIYGLVTSCRDGSSSNQHNGSKNVDSDKDARTSGDEDMDISPGSTPTEESLLEKRLHVRSGAPNSAKPIASAFSPILNQLSDGHVEEPSSINEASLAQTLSLSSATFLSTLTSLQQALHHVTPSGSSGFSKSVPSSALNLLASLPSLVNQLQEAERCPVATTVSSLCQQPNQQHILQQVIQMLQKLQQALVAQQQQQQQRQLQELLRQLLSMQQHDNNSVIPGAALSMTQQNITLRNNSADDPCEDVRLESPYSPPDSDGTPLGSPENQRCVGRCDARQSSDMAKAVESPKSNEHGGSSSFLQSSLSSPDRTVAISTAVTGGSSSVLIVIPGTGQPAALVGTSHLAAGVLRKQHDSIGLTPTLANYVNNRLTEHITGWQTDALERQINCYNEEYSSCSSLQCTQVSVDLKQARSLVRLNEIQTTLQEQRVMFIRQQMKDLENMRTGYAFQTNVHSVGLDT